MKYFYLLLFIALCGLGYVRSEQPKVWNQYLKALRAPDDSSIASDNRDERAPSDSPSPATPESITPSTTNYINPDHVKPHEAPKEVETAKPAEKSVPVVASSDATTTNSEAVAESPKAFVPPDPIPVQANWTWTVLKREYHNVVVTKVEADCVHIMYDGGAGSINQADLPPELQKMFNYDPQAAALSAQEKASALAAAEAEEAPKIAALEEQERQQAQTNAIQTPTPVSQGLSSGQRASIQAQITALQQDIAFMQAEQQKVYQSGDKQVVKADGRGANQGAYAQKILDEQNEVSQLQAELN